MLSITQLSLVTIAAHNSAPRYCTRCIAKHSRAYFDWIVTMPRSYFVSSIAAVIHYITYLAAEKAAKNVSSVSIGLL